MTPRRHATLLVVLGAFLILAGCSPLDPFTPQTTYVSCAPLTAPPPELVGLTVQPDDGVDSIIREIDAAACTIDLSVYLLSEPAIIAGLARAAERGVAVRVMLEEHPFGGGGKQQETRDQLEDFGIEVRWSGSQLRFSHAKYMVIDSQVAIIMNQNLTPSAFTGNRDFAVITTFPEEVLQAQTVFDRDWDHEDINDPPGPLILSPSNSRERMLAIIDHAESSIQFYAEIIRDPEIAAAFERALERGVSIQLIVDHSIDDQMRALLAGLVAQGMEVKTSTALYIHAKLMIVDSDFVVVGSQNPTATSLDQNREVSMVTDDPYVVERSTTIFARDWLRGAPLELPASQSIAGSGRNAFHVYFRQIRVDPTSMATAQPASTTC